MSNVSEGQKAAMAAIMKALNGGHIDNSALAGKPSTTGASQFESGSDAAKTAAMSDIMKKFRSATDNVREAAHEDNYLMEALQTERTETGVRIAEWEIAISEVAGRPGKFYDITNTSTGSKIASDLRLYEAALLLTQELNLGASINSPTVREVLQLEEEFAKHLEDAARYARIAKTATGNKQIVAEARFSDAKAKALSAKARINDLR